MAKSVFRSILGILALSSLLAACTETSDPTTTSSTSTSTTAAPATTSTLPGLDIDNAEWSREVLVSRGSPMSSSWYEDVTPHHVGFMAAGVYNDGLKAHPMAWLSRDGQAWSPISVPPELEGRFQSVANNGEVTIFVGYDTATDSGLIVRTPRGEDPVEVAFDDPVDFVEVVAVEEGFVASGAAEPLTVEPAPVAYTSTDGTSWTKVDALPLSIVEEVVVSSDGIAVEIEDLLVGASVHLREVATLFGPNGGDSAAHRIDRNLPTIEEDGFPYVMTALATDTGFILGGGDLVSGFPLLWTVDIRDSVSSPEIEVLEVERPSQTHIGSDVMNVRHLTRSEAGIHAVMAEGRGEAEVWISSNLKTWEIQELIGIIPAADRYASAETTGVVDPDTLLARLPRTVMVTSGSHPGDLFILGDTVTIWSYNDAVGYQPQYQPLFIGTDFARIVEHGPRMSQTDPDPMRSRLYHFDNGMSELVNTAWDTGWRIQSVVDLAGRTVAIGETGPQGHRSVRALPILDSGVGDATTLESQLRVATFFGAAANSRAAAAVAILDTISSDRIHVWRSEDLETWEPSWIGDTDISSAGGVCSGLDQIWIVGRDGFGFGTVGHTWSSADGATWTSAFPDVPGETTIAEFTACGGDESRVITGGVSRERATPEPLLVESTDALTWRALDLPDALLPTDRIVEVSVHGDIIGLVVEHPVVYRQPYVTAWLRGPDGDWTAVSPESGAIVASIQVTKDSILLGGISAEGSTVWQADLK